MKFEHLIFTFSLLLYSHSSLADEKILTWNFDTDIEISFDLFIKGTWEDPGLAFWKDPETVSVRARLDIKPGSGKLRSTCSIEFEFYDKDGFEIYTYKFRENPIFLLSEKSLNAKWTMNYEAFMQIEKAKLITNLPRQDKIPEALKAMGISGCSYDEDRY